MRRLLHTGEQIVAVISDALAQRLALPLVAGQAIIFYPLPIARIPVRRDLLLEPVWRHRRPHNQRSALGLPDELELVERSHRSHRMGRVGALPSPRVEPAPLPTALQEAVEQDLLEAASE